MGKLQNWKIDLVNYNSKYVGDVKLLLPELQNRLSEDEINQIAGGCGPNKLGDKFIPDKILGLCVTDACRVHDFMWFFAEDFDDKKLSDKVFHTNLLLIINQKSKYKQIKRMRNVIALGYYLAVKYLGSIVFLEYKYLD